jgi:Ig-like domain from next to BRCA1 gene
MNQSTKRILFSVMAVISLLTACAPAAVPATQDPALVQQLIEQSVALTVAAQNAQTLEAQALIPPATNTPLPTQTEAAPALPSATPFVIVPPTNTAVVVSNSGGGFTVVKPEYDCTVTVQKPLDNAMYKPNKDFDINWTIVNTGTKTMQAGLDLKHYSGPNMTNITHYELPAIKPGEAVKIVLDAKSPAKEGLQVMTWVVEGKLCFPHIAIEVSAK